MALNSIFCLFTLLTLAIGETIPDPNILVQTSSGPVQGKIVSGYTDQKSRAFLGIPYAEPPTGKLRFKPPVPVSPWTEVFNATRTPLSCYQTYTKRLLDHHRKLDRQIQRPWSEDCLTLNIWTPEVVPHDAPIVIFIHDGSFMTGTGSYPHYDLATFSGETLSVAVSFNYRLGAFGFLSLGTSDVPGNLGLMDQHLAIKWVNDNALAFGREPHNIILCGFFAGAASIGHQIINDQNAGLFKTGILFGASPTCAWTWQTKENAVKFGRILAGDLGCSNENIDSQLECMQKAHPEDIIDASVTETERFKPNFDGTFIKEPPADAMKAGRLNNVTILVVNTGAELALHFHSTNKDLLSEDSGLTIQGFDEAMKRAGLAQSETDLNFIRDWYLKTSCHNNATAIRDQAVQAYSDAFTVCCTSKFLDYATESGLKAFRIVSRIPDTRFPAWMASHAQANFPIIVADTLKPNTKYRYEMVQDTLNILGVSRKILKLTPKRFERVVPLYNLEDRPYFDWGEEFQNKDNFRTNECELWNNILPKIRSTKRECQ